MINRLSCPLRTLLQCALFLPLLLICTQALSAPTTVIDGNSAVVPVGVDVQYLEDPEGQLNIRDVAGSQLSERWLAPEKQSLNYGVTQSTHWYRFRLRGNANAAAQQWLLEIDWPLLGTVDIYRIRHLEASAPGDPQRAKLPEKILESGFLRPPGSNYMSYRNPLVGFPLDANELTEVYIRVHTAAFHLVPIKLTEKETFLIRTGNQMLKHGLAFGFLIVILCYNLLLGLSSKEDTFVKYAIYVALIFVWLTDALGYRSQVVWIEWLNPSFYVMSALLFFPPCMSFFRSLLSLNQTWPAADKFFLYAQWLSVPLLIYNYLFWETSIYVVQLYCTITFNAAIVVGIKLALEKNKTAILFLVAWNAMTVAVAVFQATCWGYTNLGEEVITWVLYAVALETILLSLIIGQRYKWLKQEKSAADKQALENLKKANHAKREHIKTQEELLATQRNQNLILEQKVADRTAALEQMIKDKSTFLSHLSHELRSPLNGLIGLLDLMNEKPVQSELKKPLGQALRTGDYLINLINNFLDFSKIEENQLELEELPFDLEELIEECLSMIQLKASQKGIALGCHVAADIPRPIYGDPIRLKQVIVNLANNALKFTETGKVEIVASLENDSVKVSVCDTGIGIPEDKLTSIFQAYSQASSDTTRKFGGTGLGLDISQKIVHLMGSAIEVKSQLGQGSEFYFYLPHAIKTAQDTKTPATGKDKARAKDRTVQFHPDSKALVVDDNPVNLMVLERQLKKLGIKTVAAHNGHEALQELEKTCFDLVFMDVHMPEMDGLEATRRIRQKNMLCCANSALPVIAITGVTEKEELEQCYDAGMSGHLAKPFQESQLVGVLEEYCEVVQRSA
ncbi:MAG: response regulator [Ketobacteraceae bacterium]|nr:response regulator [Ketobacteraceae bacterium]